MVIDFKRNSVEMDLNIICFFFAVQAPSPKTHRFKLIKFVSCSGDWLTNWSSLRWVRQERTRESTAALPNRTTFLPKALRMRTAFDRRVVQKNAIPMKLTWQRPTKMSVTKDPDRRTRNRKSPSGGNDSAKESPNQPGQKPTRNPVAVLARQIQWKQEWLVATKTDAKSRH